MTANPETILGTDTLFSSMLLMTNRGYHHLPVMEDGAGGHCHHQRPDPGPPDDPVYRAVSQRWR